MKIKHKNFLNILYNLYLGYNHNYDILNFTQYFYTICIYCVKIFNNNITISLNCFEIKKMLIENYYYRQKLDLKEKLENKLSTKNKTKGIKI